MGGGDTAAVAAALEVNVEPGMGQQGGRRERL